MIVLEYIQATADFLWGYPLIILLLGIGMYLTIRLGGVQFRKLWFALKLAFGKERKEDQKSAGDISHFQSLMTALAATVGTGNIVGVATAIAIGGPGAMFWMWITGLVGMATKYAETLLGVKYRRVNAHKEISGGPMYYIEAALGKKWPAYLYAFFGILGAIGMGNMIQANSIAQSLELGFHVPTYVVAILLMLITGLVILRGIRSIGKVTSTIVPVMIGLYFITALAIVFTKITLLDDVIRLIITHAFTPVAATGGFIGSGVLLTMRMGIARGLFSNESGLGSAAVVSAAAKTKEPKTQALIAMTQTFIDTLLVCTLTGVVILISGVWNSGLNGVALTTAAFATTFGVGANYVIALSLSLFAFSTIIGWSYYGEKFLEYLAPLQQPLYYRLLYILMVGLGAVLSLEVVWSIGDVAAALMVIPNLIALVILFPTIKQETKKQLDKKT